MCKAFTVCVVGLLLTAGMAAGESFSLIVEQAPPAPSAPPSFSLVVEQPPPVASTPPLSLPVHLPPAPIPVDPGELSPPAEAGASAPGLFTADMDYVLWAFPFRKGNRGRTAEISIPGGAITARTAASFREDKLNRYVSGARLGLGYWHVEPNAWVGGGIRTFGVEATAFVAGNQSADFLDASSPTILRPFSDLNNARPSALVVALPGVASGSFDVTAARKDLYGAEINLLKNIDYNYPGTYCSLDLLGGFRFLSLSQSLQLHRISIFNNNPVDPSFQFLAGNTLEDTDTFRTHNRFYGGQVGLSAKFHTENFTLDGTVKLALGGTDQRYLVQGQQVRILPDGTTLYFPAGLFAVPSNSGRFTRVRFSEVPEFSVQGSWIITDCLTFRLGGSALWWNRVAFPGEQVPLGVDISQVPSYPGSATAPRVNPNQVDIPMKSSSFWLVGINLGVEVAW
jgi:hypothetical protein